jgi:hypothetical protein
MVESNRATVSTDDDDDDDECWGSTFSVFEHRQ